jgi:hypothetical protein
VRRFSTVAAGLVVLFVAGAMVAACGGGGDSSSGDPNSAKYDPAHTTLKDAGLEACSEAQNQIPQNLASGPGVQNSRAFFIAVDCNGKETSPNVAMVFQFDSKDAVDSGAQTIENALPNGSSQAYGPLVIVTTGPDHQENMTKITQALQKTYPTTSSS